MHATLRQSSGSGGGPIQGTFYPSAMAGPGSGSAVLPKLLAVVAALALVRFVLHAKHGDGGGRNRRREAIAQIHRELHAADAEEVPA